MERIILNKDVAVFKKKWCNENEVIINIINKELRNFFVPPVLDVGYGMGDIAYLCLSDIPVTGIDINYATPKKFPLADKHLRLKKDFFDFTTQKQYNTLLLSHVLQYIDNDLNKLERKIEEIKAQTIIIIANKNDGIMGELVKWVTKVFPEPNPEVRILNFPKKYYLKKSKSFSAQLQCKTFEQLAEQVSYLMIIDISKKLKDTVFFLKNHLEKPEFTINQDILIYERK
ncbi:hypothetical protein GCM10011344_27580 [Dokdonia pacifica]|uniref:Methyltransferase domain-containing protein n=1 Tax=Dokdonia pacifica TaxID=1627892 RepID=A0A239CFY6_9FLAO|nr:hypothetical protein [Dokdonia pacifica]GGG25383.1 hypothetical protein GCM10011344_27580 [Dokdonia pacifica]SNS18588.1 hypothetical protein SAMN06265376_107287 [Dokdonia pacifica]